MADISDHKSGTSDLAKLLGVKPGLVCYYAKQLGFKASERTLAQHQKLVEAVQARSGSGGPKKKAAPKRVKPPPGPREQPAKRTAPAPDPSDRVARDEDLELRVLRAFYPDGISVDQYARALRVICLASEVEP